MGTMQLSLAEWKSISVGNIQLLATQLNQADTINGDDIANLKAFWDNTIHPRLEAWAIESAIVKQEIDRAKAQVPQAPGQSGLNTMTQTTPMPQASSPNGADAAPVKKRKGRPPNPKPEQVTPPPVTM